MEGTVKWFNSTKVGFITGEDGTDYFALWWNPNGRIQKLVENQSVTFEVGEGEKGPVAKILKLQYRFNIFYQ